MFSTSGAILMIVCPLFLLFLSFLNSFHFTDLSKLAIEFEEANRELLQATALQQTLLQKVARKGLEFHAAAENIYEHRPIGISTAMFDTPDLLGQVLGQDLGSLKVLLELTSPSSSLPQIRPEDFHSRSRAPAGSSQILANINPAPALLPRYIPPRVSVPVSLDGCQVVDNTTGLPDFA